MRVVFLDKQGVQGEATDDGTTYTWSYAGEDPGILADLENAATWTGVSTEPVDQSDTDNVDALHSESFDAPLTPDERIRELAYALEHHAQLVNRINEPET